MFKTIKDLIEQLTGELSSPADTPPGDHTLHLSTAVLLVEVMRAAPEVHENEYDAVLRALRRKFELSDDELQRLIELAHETARTAYDYQRFTHLLNERFTHAQKVAMVEAMWEVAYADEHLDCTRTRSSARWRGCCTSRTASTSPPSCTRSIRGRRRATPSCPEPARVASPATIFALSLRPVYRRDTWPEHDEGSTTPPERRQP